MNRIIIIGEGPTEQSFCNDVLQPFFNQHGLYIENPKIKKSKGGIVSWKDLKKQIELHLKDTNVVVTLLIDYYGIYPKHAFPKWEEAKTIVNKSERMTFLENAMAENIDDDVRYRFVPYIQLHEFEGLLFSDISVIEDNFEDYEFNDHNYLIETDQRYDNPEEINDGTTTAPSKRLERIIKGYGKSGGKVAYGSLLAQEIGLNKIREKCPRFNVWINKLLEFKED
ncbi:DUF4276 family protein [Carboxylicivirga sp. A043]|uniref:DUF4276 family protein n=1 Tax=Carboxylicivirga litoralis TaxID=2816963 RepID=UPI0021CB8172|nr:DUF4276 family protein [Carboxylicivirga sp. A043]MCU4158266.1 DUF4276 family protein [Carboxylicivirga sp. A043]